MFMTKLRAVFVLAAATLIALPGSAWRSAVQGDTELNAVIAWIFAAPKIGPNWCKGSALQKVQKEFAGELVKGTKFKVIGSDLTQKLTSGWTGFPTKAQAVTSGKAAHARYVLAGSVSENPVKAVGSRMPNAFLILESRLIDTSTGEVVWILKSQTRIAMTADEPMLMAAFRSLARQVREKLQTSRGAASSGGPREAGRMLLR